MDRNEFETQARRLRPRVMALASRSLGSEDDADDVTQETLLKMWGMREQLDEYRSIDALAFVIARRLCLDRMKRVRLLSIDEVDVRDIEQDEDSMMQERIDEVNVIIDSLPDSQQMIMRMKHIDGMETVEIARIIGSTDGAVRVQLSRARNRVKELFLNRKL